MYRKALTSDSLSTTTFSSIRNFPSPPLNKLGSRRLPVARGDREEYAQRWWAERSTLRSGGQRGVRTEVVGGARGKGAFSRGETVAKKKRELKRQSGGETPSHLYI